MKVTFIPEHVSWRDYDFGSYPDKTVCIVRYGGFGDLIQTSSVFPYFKKHGWWVVLNTAHRGYGIIKNDPYIDEVLVQHTKWVANTDLGEYWDRLEKPFTKFVQFSESTEGKLLALPWREEYQWTKERRHEVMNIDYFEQMHLLAGIPFDPKPKFYPMKKEIKKAEKFLRRVGSDTFNIMWCLSGSSVHKSWPYTDHVIAQLMKDHPNVRVIFSGDDVCKILSDAWRQEKKVFDRCGGEIRDTLTIAPMCDLVIGPETGVMNSVAYEDVPKIIMLSHSSPVNFGGRFPNTTVLTPKSTDCYPCHKLHYGWKTCNRDSLTGGAMCAASISPDRMYDAIMQYMKKEKKAA